MARLNLVSLLRKKIERFLFEKGIVWQNNGVIRPAVRKSMLRCTELEIITAYNSELRGICNYYSLASNYCKLNYLAQSQNETDFIPKLEV